MTKKEAIRYRIEFPSPYGDYGSYLTKRTAPNTITVSFCPLTGIMVLILYDGTKWVRLGLTRFPSPYGDYGSYLHPLQYDYDSFQTSFRPLTGIMVLIAIDSRSNWIGNLLCFRPLTGIMVLIRTPYKWLHSAIENAFCGADFLFSSFFTFLWKMIFKNRPIAIS